MKYNKLFKTFCKKDQINYSSKGYASVLNSYSLYVFSVSGKDNQFFKNFKLKTFRFNLKTKKIRLYALKNMISFFITVENIAANDYKICILCLLSWKTLRFVVTVIRKVQFTVRNIKINVLSRQFIRND